VLLVGAAFLSFIPDTGRGQSSAQNGTFDLALTNFLHRVLENNESIQMRLLEFGATRQLYEASWGIFEPEVFGSATREADSHQNTVVEQRSTLSDVFEEQNNIYQAGIEGLVPSGARIRLEYALRDLHNNLQTQESFLFRGATNGEFQTFLGVTLTQPLLKNGWSPAVLAGIRMAAISSEIAFQDYRRQIMVIISTAEASYWNLYMAQQQVRFFEESVATAEKILSDSRTRVQAGISSELEVQQAESGLALRRSKLSEAQGKLYEAANQVLSLYSQSVLSTNRLVRAVDRPQIQAGPPPFFDAWTEAFESNPDYLSQRQKAMQEDVRIAYAQNQTFPQVDLKASYGLNGLGDSPGSSWADIEQWGYPRWSIGVEVRVPLGGGKKASHELSASRLRKQAALLGLHQVETQVANALDTAIHKITSARQSVASYESAVEFDQRLLDSALARLEVGLLESRKVLDIEADLFEAKNSLLEATIQYRRAILELELVEGSVLKRRRLDLDRSSLEKTTARFVRKGTLTKAQYDRFLREMRRHYELRGGFPLPASSPEPDPRTRLLRETMRKLDQNPKLVPVTGDPGTDPSRQGLDQTESIYQ